MRGAKWVQQARLFLCLVSAHSIGFKTLPASLPLEREKLSPANIQLSLSGGKAARWPLLDGTPEAGTSKAQDPGNASQQPALELGASGAGRQPGARMIPGSLRPSGQSSGAIRSAAISRLLSPSGPHEQSFRPGQS